MDAAQRKQINGLYRIDGRRLARTSNARLAEVIPLPPMPPSEGAVEPLTAREIVVLQLVADGYKNREIGPRLFITEETVKSHIVHVLSRLHASNRAHAVSIAIRRRLIV